ncbi:MAG: DUF885 domain-containing protein [Alphaproteobacteria bacterium]
MPSRPVALGVLALVLSLAACSPAAVNTDATVYTLVGNLGQAELHRSPERAAQVGMSPESFGSPYDTLLDDDSLAAAARTKADRLEALESLQAVNRSTLSHDAIRQLDSATFLMDTASRVGSYGYGYVSLGWASPYLINQSDGAYEELVKFLTTYAHVSSRAGADAWLTRLHHVASSIDNERRRFEVDVEVGASPPRAILQRTLDKAKSLQVDDPRMHLLVAYFSEQLSQIADLPEADITRLTDQAAGVVKTDIKPANARLIATLEKALKTAPADPGVWRLPKGEAYYRDLLHLYTSTDLTPDQINAIGVKQVELLTAQMDPLLAAQGKIDGTVGERMAALAADPMNLYPDTPEGETALTDAISERIKWAETNLSKLVGVGPQKPVEIRRAPELSQDTAPAGYYKAGAVDGSRPATFNINLKSTSVLPIFSLPTLTFHEAIPGHHLQVGVARERANPPTLFLLASFTGFSEGWGVYAEDLADEMGAYKDDPLGKLGYLQSLLFRAARLVADTGIHHDKWTRDQAIDYMTATTGLPRAAMENEVDRYTIWPGQACAYMIGREKIRALRKQAETELGPAFDLKVLLAGGGRPLAVVDTDVRDWIASRRTPAAAGPRPS